MLGKIFFYLYFGKFFHFENFQSMLNKNYTFTEQHTINIWRLMHAQRNTTVKTLFNSFVMRFSIIFHI